MSHFTVLVIGPKNEIELEEALYPFWELDLSEEEMLNDPRAVFQIETTSEQAQEKYNAFVKKLPTAKQIRYAFEIF